MQENSFEIKIINLNWLDSLPEAEDLCLHGSVYVKIGNEIVSDEHFGDWTLSSTALFLMRSIERNYKAGDFGGQLLPCCGHTFIADETQKSVQILGCPTGIDWTIEHIENNLVKHTTQQGSIALINKEDYRLLILDFAEKIENFYQKSQPKQIENEFDRNGYLAFWEEWKSLKIKL